MLKMSLCLKSIGIFNSIKHLMKANSDKQLTATSYQFLHTNLNMIKWQKNSGTLPGSPATSISSPGNDSKSNKTKDLVKVTLMQNQNMMVTTLEEARSMASRRSMHLILIKSLDTKTQRPVYKLASNAELLADQLSDEEPKSLNEMTENNDKKTMNHKKSEKFLNIGSRISQHDLTLRLNNITKWLTKGHPVRILIQGASENDKNQCEKIYEIINQYLKDDNAPGKIIQKNSKGIGVRFNVVPMPMVMTKASETTRNAAPTAAEPSKNTGKDV